MTCQSSVRVCLRVVRRKGKEPDPWGCEAVSRTVVVKKHMCSLGNALQPKVALPHATVDHGTFAMLTEIGFVHF